MTIKIQNETAIEQAAHDIQRARQLEKLAQQVLTCDVGSIKISCNNDYTGAYLSGIENISDDEIREDLAAFLDRQAQRHRKSASDWLQYGFTTDEQSTDPKQHPSEAQSE
ncbi:MAG: hypothetical protein K2Y32_00360 [Candidatus Obscuribacterales bacterium]|nr:hypothetical protein [Candidatus Obscuribacterales bacterium]